MEILLRLGTFEKQLFRYHLLVFDIRINVVHQTVVVDIEFFEYVDFTASQHFVASFHLLSGRIIQTTVSMATTRELLLRG